VTAASPAPPPPPPAVAAGFGSRLALAQRYAELLLTEGVRRGLIGPREHDRIWDRHLANSAALADLLPHDARVVDVGSGAGLPGIPLAIVRPDLSVELLEPMQRRVDFLEECVAELGLDRVRVRRGRAPEDLDGNPAEAVVARAVAPLAALIRACAPVMDSGGSLFALKGRAAQQEMAAVRRENQRVHLELMEPAFADQRAVVVRVRRRPGRRPSRREESA
jgi:16S rRNA (guanine527-N7)-methyltransferase